MSENLKHVGKIKEAKGLKGQVYLLIFSKDASWVDKGIDIYISEDQKKVKYQVTQVKDYKDGAVISLSGVVDRNQAEALCRKEVWVASDIFTSEDGDSIYLSEILNFEVMDHNLGLIGKVIDFSSNTAQDLLIIKNQKGDQFEVPFVEAFVDEIDYETQKVRMNLPEGLLEINTSSNDQEVRETDED